jgi:hypothetical protein
MRVFAAQKASFWLCQEQTKSVPLKDGVNTLGFLTAPGGSIHLGLPFN